MKIIDPGHIYKPHATVQEEADNGSSGSRGGYRFRRHKLMEGSSQVGGGFLQQRRSDILAPRHRCSDERRANARQPR